MAEGGIGEGLRGIADIVSILIASGNLQGVDPISSLGYG